MLVEKPSEIINGDVLVHFISTVTNTKFSETTSNKLTTSTTKFKKNAFSDGAKY